MWWNMFWTEMATYEESESPELSPQHSLASVCQCLVSRSKECIFLHDQNSPVTKRHGVDSDAAADRQPTSRSGLEKVGQMPGTGRRDQDFGRWSGLTRPNQGPQLERCSH